MRRLLCLTVLGFLVSGLAPAARAQSDGDEYYNQGLDLAKAGNYREAIPFFNRAISADARHAAAFGERGYCWRELGEYDKAIADASESIRLNPNGRDSEVSYSVRGLAWLSKQEFDKAIADYNDAIRLDPTFDPVYFANRGLAWKGKGDLDRALADMDKSIQLDRANDHTLRLTRAEAYEAKGNCEKALADLKEAVRIAPNDAYTNSQIGWFLATCADPKVRDGQAAFPYASKAYQLSGGKDPSYIDTLAAAYAESGAFAQAREWQAKAIEIASKEDNEYYRPRLELYKQEKPYHKEATVAPAAPKQTSDAPQPPAPFSDAPQPPNASDAPAPPPAP